MLSELSNAMINLTSGMTKIVDIMSRSDTDYTECSSDCRCREDVDPSPSSVISNAIQKWMEHDQIMSDFFQEEKKRLEQNTNSTLLHSLSPLSSDAYHALSDQYIQQMITMIPDRSREYDGIFDMWIQHLQIGKTVGHVMIDEYGLPIMKHINIRHIASCQALLEHLCKVSKITEHSFSIATKTAIYAILELSPSVLVSDDGIGYWANILFKSGGNVILGRNKELRIETMYSQASKTVYELLKSNRYHDRGLLICPGLYFNLERHLKAYKGRYIFFVGERGNSTKIDLYIKVIHENMLYETFFLKQN